MAAGLHNEMLLAALQHFVLPALSPPLAIPPSFPTVILSGLTQFSVVHQFVSVILSQMSSSLSDFFSASFKPISPIFKSL